MSVQIKPPAAIQEIGSRDVNEDFVYPQPGEANENSRLFVVCDGLGGVDKGDVASRMVATEVGRFIQKLPSDQDLTEAQLARALSKAEESMSKHMQAVPSSMGMGTTLSLIHIGPSRVTLAWTGNSPIFYYETANKKLVKSAEILYGQSSTPVETSLPYTPTTIHGKESPAQLEVRYIPIEKLSTGDYFLLCTDGILEHVDEAAIKLMLNTGQDPEALMPEIAKLCRQGKTQDNYSCYLIQMDKLEVPKGSGGQKSTDDGKIRKLSSTTVLSDGSLGPEEVIEPARNRAWIRPVVLGSLAILAVAWIYSVVSALNQKEEKTYDQYVAEGEAYMEAEDFDRAMLSFDSAAMVAQNPSLKNRSMDMAANAKLEHEQSLYSMEELLGMGEAEYKNQNYESAEIFYRRAERAARREGTTIPDDAIERMVFTYTRLGDLYYEGENADPAKSLAYYKEAQRLGADSPALASMDEFTRATSRVPVLEEQLTSSTGGQIADAGPAEQPSLTEETKETPRSVSPRPNTSPETAVRQAPANVRTNTAPSPPSTTRSLDALDTKSNETTARTVSNVSAGVGSANSLEKGIRLFDKASVSGSNYEYKYSIINLEKAGSAIDGKGAYMLAYMYHNGLGTDRNTSKALSYAKLSARKNWPAGHYLYAHLLLLRNNRIDTTTALKSLRIAADNRFEPAMVRLYEVEN